MIFFRARTTKGPPARTFHRPDGPERLDFPAAARLVRDHLSARHLRRVRKHRLQVLLTQPAGGDPIRLLSLSSRLEHADGADDAVTGLDEVVPAEAGQLAQPRHQGLVDLLRQLVGPLLVDTFVASHGCMHFAAPDFLDREENPEELSWCTQTRSRKSKRKEVSLGGFRARSTRPTTIAAILCRRYFSNSCHPPGVAPSCDINDER